MAAFSFTAIAGWAWFKPVKKEKAVQISVLAPLPTPIPEAVNREDQTKTAPEAPRVVLEPAQETPESEDRPVEESLSSAVEVEEIAPAEPVKPAPTADPKVQEVLGFALPAGSVNSVTLEGAATRLVIPKLKVDAPVLLAPIKNQTWQVEQLGQAAGHLEGTAAPGSNSNMVLAGHVTLAETNGGPGPFYELAQLTPGDALVVYQGEKKFEYVVDSFQTVDRAAVQVTHPTETAQITLITCTNWNKNEGRYADRLVVKGHLKG